MPRPKGSKNKKEVFPVPDVNGNYVVLDTEIVDIPLLIQPLSVDYPSEGLNDMARKINEIIQYLNEN